MGARGGTGAALRGACAAAALAACVAIPSPAAPGQSDDIELTGRPYDESLVSRGSTLDLLVGAREMRDGDAWSPLDDQLELGIAFSTPLVPERPGSGLDLTHFLSWDFGLRYAFDDSSVPGANPGDGPRKVDTENFDATIGLLLSPGSDAAWIQPYVGGGAALVYSDVQFLDGTDVRRDTSTFVTGYVRGGARLRFRPGQYFGLDLRWIVDGGTDVDGIDASPESLSVSFLFGARF